MNLLDNRFCRNSDLYHIHILIISLIFSFVVGCDVLEANHFELQKPELVSFDSVKRIRSSSPFVRTATTFLLLRKDDFVLDISL